MNRTTKTSQLKQLFSDDPEILAMLEAKEARDLLGVFSNKISSLTNGKDGVKGDKGDKGDRGIQGDRGKDGKDGKDGRDGRDGKDGRSIKGEKGEKGEPGRDGKDANIKEIIEIISPYEKRIGSLEKSNTLSPKGNIDQRWHGAGLSKVSTDSSLTGLGTPASPLSVVSSGGGFTLMIPTGTVNGNNLVFVFSSAPSVVVLDNANMMNKVSKDGTVNWTGTTTITLTQAPNFNIYGF